MEPDPALATRLADLSEMIDAAEIGGSGSGDHASDAIAMFVQRCRNRGASHSEVVIDGNGDDVGVHDSAG